MYKRESSHRCVHCGHTWSPSRVAHTVPTRAADSECGDILGNGKDGVSNPCVRRRMCNDGSHCSITAGGIKEISEGVYVVVCGIHND